MTPPPSAGGTTTAGRLGRAGVAPRIPRRTSGPARPRAATAPPPTRRPRPAPPVLQSLRRLPDAKVLDRLLRGRAWIALIAVALLGIVFMQVSLLKLNAGISRAVSESDLLERQNSQLRAAVSGLDAEARIDETARLTGLQMPAAGDVRYLDARQADPARAARSITPPDRVRAATIRARLQGTAPTSTSTGATTGAASVASTGSATGTTTPSTTTSPATTPSTTSATTGTPSTTSGTTTTPPAAATTSAASPTPAPTPTATTATTSTSTPGAVTAPPGAP